MKWEDYNQMSVKEKEEYNFKFKEDYYIVDAWKYFDRIAIVTTWLMVLAILCIERGLPYIDILKTIPNVIVIGLGCMLFLGLISMISVSYHIIKEYLWLKNKGYSKNMHKVKKQ